MSDVMAVGILANVERILEECGEGFRPLILSIPSKSSVC